LTTKKTIAAFTVILVLVVFAAGYLLAKSSTSRALLTERLKQKDAQVELLESQIKTVSELVAKQEAALAQVQSEAAARERWFQAQLSAIQTATPQELVDDGARLLAATDITTDGQTVTMGVETWRKAVTVLLNEEEYRLTREPSWRIQMAGKDDVIAGLKQQQALAAQRDDALKASVNDLKAFISKGRLTKTAEKVLWAAAGFGAGVLFEQLRGK